MTASWVRRVVGATAIGVVLAGGLSACQVTTNYQVSSTTDAPDAAVGDGTCASVSDGCTLRAAVQEANAHAGPVQITLAEGATYGLTIPGADENQAVTGDLDLLGDVTINGHGAVIDGNGLDRVIHVRGGSAFLHDLTIRDGTAGSGGGVRVDAGATAKIATSTISGNVADGFRRCWTDLFGLGLGGCSSEYVAVDNPFYYHLGEGGGAGVWNGGVLSIWDSTISANVVPDGPSGCWTFIHAAICDGGRNGGGLYSEGSASIVNSTISGNSVTSALGAAVAIGSGTTTMLYGTIADNTQTDPTGTGAPGASVLGTPIMGASVIEGVGELCSAPLTSLGYNVSSDASCFSAVTDRSSTPAGLGALTTNGGPTATHAPVDGSALSDSIPATADLCGGAIRTDQRGADRRIGFPCTVGSVEAFEP